jgi:hypothetical protein
MIVTIHQPEHLPWLGFCDKMRQADIFVLLDSTQFAKGDFQNRNRIKTRTGPKWLTVPVYQSGRSDQLIEEVEICNDRNWRNRCWSLMEQSYREAPFFEQIAPFFEDLYGHDWTSLVELNATIIGHLRGQLGLDTLIVRSSDLGIYTQGATEVNLSICERLNADVYLSGKFGRDYLDEECFTQSGIEVRYQDFHHPAYPQLWGEFVPNMSSVDLLFNCGGSSLEVIERANEHAPTRSIIGSKH